MQPIEWPRGKTDHKEQCPHAMAEMARDLQFQPLLGVWLMRGALFFSMLKPFTLKETTFLSGATVKERKRVWFSTCSCGVSLQKTNGIFGPSYIKLYGIGPR